MQRMSDAGILARSRQLDPTAYANELMSVLSRTDTATARAALKVADILNDYRVTGPSAYPAQEPVVSEEPVANRTGHAAVDTGVNGQYS
jgi:hypothetical protein